MAQIPDSLPEAAVEGVRPSTATVAPTDFGLGQVADSVAQLGEINARRDRKLAAPLLTRLQGENDVALAADAAAYTGDAPGFAADQLVKARGRVQAALGDPSLTPGVKRQLADLSVGELSRVGEQANAHEAKVRAEPILAQHLARDAVEVNGGLTAFQLAFAPKKQQLHDSYDGSTPGYTKNVADAFDEAQTAALAATPVSKQGEVAARLAVLRTEEIAGAATTEQHSTDAYVLKNGQDQADALINTVSSNPLAYETVVNLGLPGIADTLPKGLRKDVLHEFQGQAAMARIKGLVDQDKADQAQAELNDGRYDALLPPKAKEALLAHVEAAQRYRGPKTFDEQLSANDVEARANAETYARMTRGQSTGQVNLDEIAGKLSPAKAADYATQWAAADRAFAVSGSVRDAATPDLHAVLAAPAPEPADPDYVHKIVAWQTAQTAAQAELKARQEPGAWAYAANPAKGKAAAAGAGQAQDRGSLLQQTWTDYLSAQPGPARMVQGGVVAGRALGAQRAAGIPASAYQVIPQGEAARLAATVVNAPPEQKLDALAALAGLVHDLPASFTMADGQTVAPQAIMTRQLMAAHVTPGEVAAMVDFGADPARLGRYVAAINDPTLKTALPHGAQANLKAQVLADLKPWLDAAAPLPGARDLAEARIERTVLIARGLMAHQGLDPGTAARTAARDMTGDYRFVDSWRMPVALASARDGVLGPDGAAQARAGAAQLLGQLTANHGEALFAAGGAGGAADQRRAQADKLAHFGRWVTAPDDSGLVLMFPHPDGGWEQVQDRYGRPVRAGWSDLQAAAKATTNPMLQGAQGEVAAPPSRFAIPPPTALRSGDGAALPAVSKQAAFSALAWAVNGKESHFQAGLVSPKGALGQMQLMPDTVKTYAPRLGLPVDLERAQHDDAYNRRIGEAALQDHVQHYGPGAGVALALAAYNAGPGRLDGYRDPATNAWHAGWLQTIGDPRSGKISLNQFVDRIPIPETRDYVRTVLPAALKRLQGGH